MMNILGFLELVTKIFDERSLLFPILPDEGRWRTTPLYLNDQWSALPFGPIAEPVRKSLSHPTSFGPPTASHTQLRIVGLTGGISTGKTTVSNYLATTYQLPIFDADIYAREAVQPGSWVIEAIAQRYGNNILLSDGHLNRKALGNIIFNNPTERQWVEQQIHPYVRQRLVEAIEETRNSAYPQKREMIILVVPLLFEAQMTDLVTEIWVVSCARELQLQRLMARDALSLEPALSRIDSQMPIEEKAAVADVVLDNSSTQEELLQQVDAALKTRNFRV